jgi:hypothetical protein
MSWRNHKSRPIRNPRPDSKGRTLERPKLSPRQLTTPRRNPRTHPTFEPWDSTLFTRTTHVRETLQRFSPTISLKPRYFWIAGDSIGTQVFFP